MSIADAPAFQPALTDKLNLAIVGSRGFPSTYGGYETLVRYLARDWFSKGHSVSVYCRSRTGSRRVWITDGVRCIWTPGLDTLKFSTLSFGATAAIDASLRRYDAVLVLNIANGFYLPLMRARRVSTVVNTDGVEWERGKWGPLARRLFRVGARMTAHYADVLVADSQVIADLWQSLFGVESLFIPYGAPILSDPGADKIAALGLERRRYVLVVARLIPENNVALIHDAVESLSPRPVLVIVGAAPNGSPLYNKVEIWGSQDNVRMLGHVEDQALLAQLWANAGVYVHGHSVGGTNPGLLQALGAGAPTVALDTPFNREVIQSDEQMFPHRAADLAAKVADVLADAALQDRLADHGRAVVARSYKWPEVSQLYLSALLEARRRSLHEHARSAADR
jgi:glycosyltransferase involved in cell wall biosynthesis